MFAHDQSPLKEREPEIFNYTLIIIFTVPLLYTLSRSSYLAVIPAIMTFIFLSEKRNLVVGSILLIGLILPFTAPRIAKDRIYYTFSQGRNRGDVVEVAGIKLDTSTSARLNSWMTSLQDWFKHPFLGYGVTGYRFVDAQYVKVLTETGILGLISFLFLISKIFKRAYNTYKESTDTLEKGISMGFLAGFIGLIFHAVGANTFIIVRIMEPFWFMTAIIVTISELREGNP